MGVQSTVQSEYFLHIPDTVSKEAQDFLRTLGDPVLAPPSPKPDDLDGWSKVQAFLDKEAMTQSDAIVKRYDPTVISSGGSVAAQEWSTLNNDYSNQRYVDLDQITPQKVGGLKELYEFQLNEASWFSSSLLMVDRTLYVNTMCATYAIDATTFGHALESSPGYMVWGTLS